MTDTAEHTPVDAIYRAGAAGMPCWSRDHRGLLRELPMRRWLGAPDVAAHDRLADELVMRECSAGTTLDLGCGPGRFTAALQHRGAAALGVDASAVAVALTRQRGGTAMRRDLFGWLPAQGGWDRVLLADGNIGIGGNPVRTLRRAAELLAPGGQVIVEIDHSSGDEVSISHEFMRWESHHARGPWFHWARLGAVALSDVATAGLTGVGPRPEELATRLGVKSVLVMRSDPDSMVVAATAGEATRHYTVGAAGKKAGQDDACVPLYCERIVDTGDTVFVEDSRADTRFAGNEDETEFGLSNYLGMAVHDAHGRVVGTVCVLDDHARHYDADEREALDRVRAEVEAAVIRNPTALG